jgi:dedicated sortase system histidine kinase
MKLRKQLLLVSLFILVLPWAGCQYIREMEAVLINGQARALEATAHAVSAHLQSQSVFAQKSENPSIDLQKQLYFHQLRYEPILDGYLDSWLLPTLNSRTFLHQTQEVPRLSLFTGIFQDYAYFIFEVTDNERLFHDPQAASIASGDHIILRLLDDNQKESLYYLRTSGEGPFSARYINPEGQIRQEHRIRGFWAENPQGYTIEILLPLRVLGQHIEFAYAKRNGIQLGTLNTGDKPPPWVTALPEIESIIDIYSDEQTRIQVVDPRGWLLAQTGSLGEATYTADDDIDWQASIYRLALNNMALKRLDNPSTRGRMDGREVQSALQGSSMTELYQDGNQRVARTAVPILQNNRVVGAVVVEQSTESLIAGTNTAFNRLFYYVGIAFVVVFFGIFTFATILSIRIRRLSKAADNAIGDDGKIKSEFIHSSSRDELGDLTRSYGQLLTRLRDYTDYLRTLASKLSHELRTPLAVVRSSLENLDHPVDAAEANQYRQRAKEGAERLGNILSAMSSASHMEDSIQHTPTENFQLDRLLTEVSAAYRSTYTNNNIQLDIESADYQMHGSPDLIVQMLDKLVDNAVDFCPSDGMITIKLQRTKNNFMLSVSNTGPLLPAHMQGQLFDSLVSVRESNGKNQKTHLGLGLYIVRLIVDFHRGKIQASNLEDHSGVSFDIQFPRDVKNS